ncbi:MAG: hypothetical protein HUJ61_05575, partial [Bacilli bacterium]|nr:hypothetical protein [Bacilli bacterium]
SMGKLIKFIGLPVVLFNVSGAYTVSPRWSKKSRYGKTTLSIKRILTPEEYKDMEIEEIDNVIKENLYVSEYEPLQITKGKHLAECIERVIYRCPKCGVTHFVSKGNKFKCESCGLEGTFNNDQSLTLSESLPKLTTLKEWYDYQEKTMSILDYESLSEDAIIEDKKCSLNESIRMKGKIKLGKNKVVQLYKDKLIFDKKEYNFEEIDFMSIVMAHTLEFSSNGHTYQIKGDDGFNAIKYLHFYYKYKNTMKGEPYDTFFGL